ncbi:MAG: hypothetical protein M1822_008531 [Bathelium mastoideum]|nr:MAG: hypothetical protein M1822_008531 [Bathelium mastoideum]
MSTYEVEHNVPKDSSSSQPPPRRPDLSTFFSALEHVDTSGARAPQNQHALPHPVDVAAAFRTLANSFAAMQSPSPSSTTDHSFSESSQHELLARLVQELVARADDPPREVEGVSDEFLAGLDRVPRGRLKRDETCPICANGFLEDEYPLVVRLPCRGGHIFDLECVGPWLKLNPSCPLDREVLVKKKEEKKVVVDDDEEDEGDMMYA